jgi:mRNA interferase MazF
MASVPVPHRGDIWLADFDPVRGHEQGGRRPALVVSANRLNRSRADLVIIIPLTRTARNLPTHVSLAPPEGGVLAQSFIMCEQIRVHARERLQSRWGHVSAATMEAVEERLRTILGL